MRGGPAIDCTRGFGLKIPRVRLAAAFALAGATVALGVAAPAASARQGSAPATGSACIAHRPSEAGDIYYAAGCTGHDEPELDPVSSAPKSAKDLTWNVILPTNGTYSVGDVGPTFWFGGTVNDPVSLFGQAFLEVQFYPDSVVTKCTQGGGYKVTYSPNTYSACSPVWKVENDVESAAFNAMLTNGKPKTPLLMHAGDSIKIHFYTTPGKDGWHITVTDVTRGGSGTIVLNSKTDGPLMPSFNKQEIGNSLGWGVVHDAPNSFVWEIGHTSNFASPPGQFCVPGQTNCPSYDASWWAGQSPIKIKSVVFGDGSRAKDWAVVSDYGGTDEVDHFCGVYGGPYCIYPWYTSDGRSFSYGVDYPDTVRNYGQAAQFATQPQCGGPFGPDTTYCMTTLNPAP